MGGPRDSAAAAHSRCRTCGEWRAVIDAGELKEWRKARRRDLLVARAALTPKEHQLASEQLFAHVDAVVRQRAVRSVGAYLPIRNEPDPLQWIEQFVTRGGTVALPVMHARDGVLSFHCWAPGERLRAAELGTRCPAEARPIAPELLLVPLVGFDTQRFRLGFGGGFYDRTLASLSTRPYSIGVGFSLARLETIHAQPYDQPMDAIVTELGPV